MCSFSVGLALTACAATPTASPAASNDAPSNATQHGPEEVIGIVTPDTNSIVVRILAGLTPPSPAPRACAYNALYTLNLKTHELSWDFCFAAEKDNAHAASPARSRRSTPRWPDSESSEAAACARSMLRPSP